VTATRQNATFEGVRDSWDFWLSQHPVTLSDIVEDAIKTAVSKWLNCHEEQLIAAIARAVADKAPLDGPDERG
jgi:hypothetical protein